MGKKADLVLESKKKNVGSLEFFRDINRQP